MERLFRRWLKNSVSDRVPNPLQLGALAEDTVEEVCKDIGLKTVRANAGSLADVRDKVDIIVLLDNVVHMIQVKLGNGTGSRTVPHPPIEVVSGLLDRDMKVALHVIHIYGDVMNGSIAPHDMLDALKEAESIIFTEGGES